MEPSVVQALVHRTARRLALQTWIQHLVWGWSAAGLLITLLAVVAKLMGRPLEHLLLASAAVLALATLAAAVTAVLLRPSPLRAAALIDDRLGLEDRVLSVMSLPPEQLDYPAVRLLIEETAHAVQGRTAADFVRLGLPRHAWAPLLPLLLAAVCWLVLPQLEADKTAAANVEQKSPVASNPQELKERLERSVQPLKDIVRELEKAGSDDSAGEVLDQLRRELETLTQDLTTPRADEKSLQKSLEKLSELEKRLKEVQERGEIQKATARTLEQVARNALQQQQKSGLLGQFQDAMRRGDLERAARELQKLAEQLEKSSLSEEQKEQLKEQLAQMQKALEDLRKLKKAQEELARSGLGGEALQKALEALRQQLGDPEQLEQIAQRLQQALNGMNSPESAAALQQLAQQLQSLAEDLRASELADDLLQALADMRARMACPECKGAG